MVSHRSGRARPVRRIIRVPAAHPTCPACPSTTWHNDDQACAPCCPPPERHEHHTTRPYHSPGTGNASATLQESLSVSVSCRNERQEGLSCSCTCRSLESVWLVSAVPLQDRRSSEDHVGEERLASHIRHRKLARLRAPSRGLVWKGARVEPTLLHVLDLQEGAQRDELLYLQV